MDIIKIQHIVVGGSGFIGSHLRENILNENVLIIDINRPKKIFKNEFYMYADIREKIDLNDSYKFDSNTILHHLAAVHFDFQTNFFPTNVKGTNNIIMKFSKHISKWIFYSSVATYGDNLEIRDESSLQNPVNDYGKSKLLMEENIIKYYNENIIQGNVVIVRPGVVFGERNFGNVFNLMNFSLRFLPIGLSVESIKSMAYVKNLISSTIFAIGNCNKDEVFVYNYVDYPQISTKTLLKIIAVSESKIRILLPYNFVIFFVNIFTHISNKIKIPVIINSERVKKFSQPTHFSADKIRNIGWVQPVSFKTGIERTLNWIKNNNVNELRREWKNSLKDL